MCEQSIPAINGDPPKLDGVRLWPITHEAEKSVRLKRTTIKDHGLFVWHPFEIIHVGLASYIQKLEVTFPNGYAAWLEQKRAFIDQEESERTWWRSVGQLQKFVNP